MAATGTQGSAAASADGTVIAYRSLGAGEGIIVGGGAFRAGRAYLPLARVLAASFRVHVVDRRGRGGSGPQGADYSVAKECEDLLAVQAATGATAVFRHSYGGLIALESARRSATFGAVAVYEPGVSVGGSIPFGWMTPFRQRLATGDTRGAFACMVRGVGAAPGGLAIMPRTRRPRAPSPNGSPVFSAPVASRLARFLPAAERPELARRARRPMGPESQPGESGPKALSGQVRAC